MRGFGPGLRNANYIDFSASVATDPMQRMVIILDTVQQLLYFPNAPIPAPRCERAIPVRDSEAVYPSKAKREDALLRLPSADKTTRENCGCYLLECYED